MTTQNNFLLGLDYILDFLSREIDLDNVRLFFVERNKERDDIGNEIVSYNVYRSEFNSSNHSIERELVRIAKNTIRRIYSDSLIYVPYQPTTNLDRDHVEILDTSDVPNFESIYTNIFGNPPIFNLEIIGELENVWGYLLRIPVNFNDDITFNGNLFFVRKYTLQKLLGKKFLTFFLESNSGRWDVIRDTLTIDTTFDGVIAVGYYTVNDTQGMYGKAYIFNKGNFEQFFSFNESYEREVLQRKQQLLNTNIIDQQNLDFLIDKSKGDLKKIKKLADILRSGYYTRLNPQVIRNIKTRFGLEDLQLDNQGRIVVTPTNIWTVLKLLHDDYLESPVTGYRYEVHSKKRT